MYFFNATYSRCNKRLVVNGKAYNHMSEASMIAWAEHTRSNGHSVSVTYIG